MRLYWKYNCPRGLWNYTEICRRYTDCNLLVRLLSIHKPIIKPTAEGTTHPKSILKKGILFNKSRVDSLHKFKILNRLSTATSVDAIKAPIYGVLEVIRCPNKTTYSTNVITMG